MNSPHSTCTTIMAVEYNGGVVMGADSKTTTGDYVANRIADKITPVRGKIYCCRSGAASDTQAIADIVAYSLDYHENTTGEEPLVAEAASEFCNFCYKNRDSLHAGIIVAGWDKRHGGQVYSIPLGGMIARKKCSIGGSGSTYIMGLIKDLYHDKMSKDECYNFVLRCIKQAIHYDKSSGGVIRTCIINGDGIERKTHVVTSSGNTRVIAA